MSMKQDIALRKKIAAFLVKARKVVAEHKAEYRGTYRASGGGGTTQSNTTSIVPADVLAEYNQVTQQANQVASAPLNQYQGQVVAGLTPAETSAFHTINNMQGTTGPVTSDQIQNYESPYTQDVLNTTMTAENNQDAQQQEQLKGNAISAGAWGGDRSGVAQGILGGQQAIANNATNAGIANQGYSQALNEANVQQAATFNNTLAGANAQLTAGQLQQQQAQSELNVPYQQFLQAQSYPFQTTGWLGNIAEGIGSNEGGSSTSSTTQPSQGLFGLKRGGIVPHLADGGSDTPPAYEKGSIGDIMHPKGRVVTPTTDSLPTYRGWYEPDMPSSQQVYSSVPAAAPAPTGITSSFSTAPAPTYAQFAASNPTSGTPSSGGMVPGLNAANQADLASIYKGFKRGGIVPQHFDDGGEAVNPNNGSQADFAMSVPDISFATPDASALTSSVPFDDNGYGAMLDSTSGTSQPSRGIAPPPPTPPITASDRPSNYLTEMPTPHEANPWLSVAAGVLGTLAGRSRNPLVDIGEGGLIGLNNYSAQTKEAQAQNFQEGSFHQNAQKLMDEAELEKNKYADEQKRTGILQQNADTMEQYRKDQSRNQSRSVVKLPDGRSAIFDKEANKLTPVNMNGLGLDGADANQPTFGFPVQNMSPIQQKQALSTDAKLKATEDANYAIGNNASHYLDVLEQNINNPAFSTGEIGAGARGTLGKWMGNETGDVASAIDTNANSLVGELTKLQYVPGMRGSVLGLQTALKGKPSIDQPISTNLTNVNLARAKVADFQLSSELNNAYREANPMGVADANAQKLDQALKAIYPIEEVAGGKSTFNKDNVQKIRDVIPDAIANPKKYFDMAKEAPKTSAPTSRPPLSSFHGE